jgi:hypothetical protein
MKNELEAECVWNKLDVSFRHTHSHTHIHTVRSDRFITITLTDMWMDQDMPTRLDAGMVTPRRRKSSTSPAHHGMSSFASRVVRRFRRATLKLRHKRGDYSNLFCSPPPQPCVSNKRVTSEFRVFKSVHRHNSNKSTNQVHHSLSFIVRRSNTAQHV